ncbi:MULTISPECIES: hypothetical protein [unclassified Rhizobium]|uniref:hypothetical protein n=1 Tax=unclassified Rhizobium TaxID=2613769 RepID=UPI000BCE2CFB|nr:MULTISPECIES: hypothetical protein [unclassified Rhizobium]MDH7805726.1 hypothetical protein [Rhizobium sp. AN67]MDQ4407200.1 hypothetical protein [Rhizobium sp. AN63]SOD59777.1 hypothetical protein SAMN05216595_4948 [Rhizobium sp. AN6A]
MSEDTPLSRYFVAAEDAFRDQLNPAQRAFYDQLNRRDQSRYRDVPADRRDNWQDVWEAGFD